MDLQCLICKQLLQEEFESYRSTAEAVAESKDAELTKALEGNAQLRSQLTELQSNAKEVCALFLFSLTPPQCTTKVLNVDKLSASDPSCTVLYQTAQATLTIIGS